MDELISAVGLKTALVGLAKWLAIPLLYFQLLFPSSVSNVHRNGSSMVLM